MRGERIITVSVWTFWSAFIAAVFIYLGSGTEEHRDRVWLLDGLTGAALGGVGGLTALRVWGNRGGVLLMGIPFGLLFGVGATFLWAGK